MNGLALCAGIGGIELGLKLALGRPYRTVGYVERDSYAAAILVARMGEAALDPAPVWDDLTTFDGTTWRGRVDLVTAGFPCQPVSLAGKRLAQEDERWLWPEVARIVCGVEPQLVFLENVPGLLVRGFGDVLRDLAELGFDAEWGVFSAAGSGAPHLRRRVFILASNSERADLREQPGRGDGESGAGEALARVDGATGSVADTDGGGLEGKRQRVVLDGQREALRDDPDGRGGEVSLALGEGLEGVGEGLSGPCGWWATEPALGRVAHGIASRVDRLRCLGNGVVPAVAARAFQVLAERLGTCTSSTR